MNLPLFHEKGDTILKWIEADEDIELTTVTLWLNMPPNKAPSR